MARARNIKPGLLKNEILGVADPLYTILFEGLWILADREGRLEDRHLRIKAETFPYREGLNVDAMLGWLQEKGFILRYQAEGKSYIQVIEFAKHQNPHRDEKKSEIPAPNLHSATTVQPHVIDGTCRADSLIPDPLNLIPDPLVKPSPAARKKSTPVEDQDFVEAYSLYPSRPGSSKASALKAWQARLASGVDPQAMIAGVRRYAAFVRQARTEPNFIKMPATFFGPDRHFDSDWTFIAKAAGPPGYQTANDKAKAWADSLTGRNRNHEPDNRTIIDLNDAPAHELG